LKEIPNPCLLSDRKEPVEELKKKGALRKPLRAKIPWKD